MNDKLRLALGYVLCALYTSGLSHPLQAQTKPEGEMRWALYVTLRPPGSTRASRGRCLTPFWVLYALHDALVKPMPGNRWPRASPNPGR